MEESRVGYVRVDNEAVAVFIDSAGDSNPGCLITYAWMGEHAEASLEWVRAQPLASEELYAKMHGYLTRRYGNAWSGPEALKIDQAAVPR